MPRPSRHVTTITFDADETLWQFADAQQRAFARVLPELQLLVPNADGMRAADLAQWHREFTQASDPTRSWEERRLDAFRRTLGRLGRHDDAMAKRLTAAYLRVRYDTIKLLDDVQPALRALGQRYRLGLISNGNTRATRCGLAGVFDFELYAEDHDGARKPSRRMFDVAIARAGGPPSALAHVGDSLAQDVVGALEVGAVAIWLNRGARPGDAAVDPTCEIRSLADLAPSLDAFTLARGGATP
jgi:FMN hydrolase / 5-amino-6-(5-phospho-D-ribitylamino)uracil phosphatase